MREFFEKGKIIYGDFKIEARDPDFRQHFILEQGEIHLFLYTKLKKDVFQATLKQNRINPLTKKPLSYVSDVTITYLPSVPTTSSISTLFSFFKESS